MVKLVSEDERIGGDTFSKCFIPENDPELRKIGLEICAVTKIEKNKVKNRIIFKMGDKTSDIECIHTSVCQLVSNPESETGFEVVSTDHMPFLSDTISPEDHFFSLKSFTQALVENGIQKTLLNALEKKEETGREPLDFNDEMRSQLTKALIQVAPKETKDLALSNLEYIVGDDPKRLEAFGNDFNEVISSTSINRADIDRINKIAGGIHNLPMNLIGNLLMNPSIPEEFLEEYIKSDESFIRECIARNPSLPKHLLSKLFYDENPFVVESLLKHQPIPKDIIYKVITSDTAPHFKIPLTNQTLYGNTIFLKALASNENIQEDTMRELAEEPDPDVRELLASNPSLIDELVGKLAYDEDEEVRIKVAEREYLPDDIFEALSEDLNEKVLSAFILARGKLPSSYERKFANNKSHTVRMAMASRADLPEDLYNKLLKDNHPYVRGVMATRDDLPLDLVYKFADEEDTIVLQFLATREPLPNDLIKKLAESDDDDVRFNIVSRQTLPIELMRVFAKDPVRSIRDALAGKDFLPIDVIRVLAGDEDPFVREEIADKPDLPIDVIEKLVNDEDYEVLLSLNESISERFDIPDHLKKLAKTNLAYLKSLMTDEE